jgi:hypothetical protein
MTMPRFSEDTDTDTITDDTANAEAVDAEATEVAAEGEAAPATPKRQKDPVPEGFVSPVQFAKEIDKHLVQEEGTTRPQMVYGYIKNSKTFPFQEREGFPKFIVNLAEGLTWIDEKQVRSQERAAKKAAAEAAAAAEPSEGEPVAADETVTEG